MPIQGQTPICFLNGDYVPFRDAKLPVYDLAVMQGATITERLRTFRHQPFAIEEHLNRLKKSLELVNWKGIPQLAQLPEIIRNIADSNCQLIPENSDLAVVIFISPGQSVGDSNGLVEESTPTVCVYTASLPFGKWSKWYQEGVELIIPSTRQIPGQSLDPRIKMRSRLHWCLADQEAREINPNAQALLLDQDNFLTETSSGNLIVFRNGVAKSPKREKTLNGITQQLVSDLQEEQNVSISYEDLTINDLLEADEAILTSSTYCIAPVVGVNGQSIGSDLPGSMTQDLSQSFSKKVGLDFVDQAKIMSSIR